MDAKQIFDCPASPSGDRGRARMGSLEESDNNRAKYEGPVDTLMTSTLKTAIVRFESLNLSPLLDRKDSPQGGRLVQFRSSLNRLPGLVCLDVPSVASIGVT